MPVVSISFLNFLHWLRTSSSLPNRITTESSKPLTNILIKRMDLKSGILPTFNSYCDTGIRKRYHFSVRVVPFARLTIGVLTSVIKFVPEIMLGLISTLYWKYSSDSFMVLSRFSSSASGYWVKAFTNCELLSLIGELP